MESILKKIATITKPELDELISNGEDKLLSEGIKAEANNWATDCVADVHFKAGLDHWKKTIEETYLLAFQNCASIIAAYQFRTPAP